MCISVCECVCELCCCGHHHKCICMYVCECMLTLQCRQKIEKESKRNIREENGSEEKCREIQNERVKVSVWYMCKRT